MAKKLGRLAGLAALAGAAYMIKNKFDKDATGPAATAAEIKKSEAEIKAKRDAVSGNKSAETQLKTPAQSIAEADKSDKSTPISTQGGAGTTTLGTDKSAVDLSEDRNKPVKPAPVVAPAPKNAVTPKSVSEPSDKSIKLAPEKRDLEKDMSRGTRTPAKPVSTVSSSAEGMTNYKPRRTPAAPSTAKSTVSSSAEGMKNYKPRSTQPSATKSTPPVAAKPTTSSASNSRVPTSEQAAANRQAVYDKVKSVGSSVGDYVKNFETPAERRARERKESSGMRRGGAVKMASGGITASRRGDGIAQRGKTRGKLC